MMIPILNNAWSEAEYDRVLHASGPTLALRGKRIQSITSAANAISAWASRVGAISFTQTTEANKPKLTRADNLENRFKYSEDFSQAATWEILVGLKAVTGNEDANPLTGVQTADRIVEDNSNGLHRFRQLGFPVVAGQPYRISFYAKSSNRRIGISTTTGFSNQYLGFDLTTGTTYDSSGTGANLVTMAAVPGYAGWYYCAATPTAVTTSAVGNTVWYFSLPTNGTTWNSSYQGDNASYMSIYGAQFRSALADPTYIATTSAPQYRGVNGRPAVYFDGGNAKMTSSDILSDIVTAGAKTAILGFKPLALGTNYILAEVSGPAWSAYVTSSSSNSFRHQNNDGTNDISAITGTAVNTTYISSVTHGTGNLYSKRNGVNGNITASGNTADLTKALQVSGVANSAYFAGTITDILTWNKVLSSQTIDKLTRLAAKERGACLN